MPDPKVYVLVPVHNRCVVTVPFAERIRAQSYSRVELVIVDDGSTDGTGEGVRRVIPHATILRGDGHLWWAGSLDRGLEYIASAAGDADIVLIINDDVIVDDDFIARGVMLLLSRLDSLLLAQHADKAEGIVESGIHFDARNATFNPARTPSEINCLSTRGLFLTLQSAKRIGRFHTFILPHYGSDYEWTIRAGRKGLKLWTDPSLTLTPMRDKTGYHPVEGKVIGYKETLHLMFSRRSAGNVMMRTGLFLLTVNATALPRVLFRLWGGAIWRLSRTVGRAMAQGLARGIGRA